MSNDNTATKEMAAYCFDSILSKFDSNYACFNPPSFSDESYPLFVTWNIGDDQLRGCIGTFSTQTIHKGLWNYSRIAAFNDNRFKPVTLKEIPKLSCGVSLLTNFEKAKNVYDWIIGKHGIIIDFNINSSNYNATYLPEVASEQDWDHDSTLQSLIRKSGFRGSIDKSLLSKISLQRYQSSKVKLSWSEYLNFRQTHSEVYTSSIPK